MIKYEATGLCPSCLSEVDEDNMNFCPNCGAKIEKEEKGDEEMP